MRDTSNATSLWLVNTKPASPLYELDEVARTRFMHLVSSLFDGDVMGLVKYLSTLDQAHNLLAEAKAAWAGRSLSHQYGDYWPLMESPVLAAFVYSAEVADAC